MQMKLHAMAPSLILSLLVVGTIVSAIVSVASANSTMNQLPLPDSTPMEAARVHIYPEEVSGINVGETFTVTVAVSGLDGNDLYGFDIIFTWNTDALRYVSHEAKVPMETHPEGLLREPITEVKNDLDASGGTYWFVCASILPAQPCNKDGTIFTIDFVLLKPTDYPYAVEYVRLANKNGDPIPTEIYQKPEISFPPVSDELQAHRLLRNARWLEWWIEVTWQSR